MAAEKVTGDGSKAALDGSKLRVDLVPPQMIQAVAQVLGFGAKKYAAHNWMKGIAWSQLAAGVKRHLASFETGEEIDPESGLPHLAHALCGLMFLHYEAHGPANRTYRTFDDDRVFKELYPLAVFVPRNDSPQQESTNGSQNNGEWQGKGPTSAKCCDASVHAVPTPRHFTR